MKSLTYHRNKTKLTSNKRGDSPTLCKMDSAMSIGFSGRELESTRAEPAMRTMTDFNDLSFNLPRCLLLTLCQKTNHTPPGIEHTASDTLVPVMVPVSPLLHASCAKLRNVNK